jgi:hypothetical protein
MNIDEMLPVEQPAAAGGDLPILIDNGLGYVPEYHYTGSQQPQIGGDGPIPGSTWSTAHDNPLRPDYISLGPGPLYGEAKHA